MVLWKASKVIGDSRTGKRAQLTLATKRDLEHQRDPRQEPCTEGLREIAPVDVPQPGTALYQALLIRQTEWGRRF